MSQNTRTLLINSLNLPHFETIDELAKLIGLSSRLLYCLSIKTNNYYKEKSILKKNGSLRKISIPSYSLHIVQRWILVNVLNKITPSNRAMAFRKGYRFGHKQNAFYHSHTLYGLSLDLKDFFPSITANKVYTIFSSIGYNNFASTILTNLCVLDGKLPQGSACSPIISNIICLTLDKRLIGLCEKSGIRFTRYADDMYFSCDDKVLLLKSFPIITKIIKDEGFIVNINKTHFHTPSNKKQITGVIVSNTDIADIIELKAPRKIKQTIRAEIHRCIFSGNYENKQHILGEIAYVNFIEKENKSKYLDRINKYINSLTKQIEVFPELVEAYNSNKFFKDTKPINATELDIIDDEDYYFYKNILQNRKIFLKKNNLNDKCRYSNWPSALIESKDNVSEYIASS